MKVSDIMAYVEKKISELEFENHGITQRLKEEGSSMPYSNQQMLKQQMNNNEIRINTYNDILKLGGIENE